MTTDTDVLDWLKAERDRHAAQRDEAYRTDDWKTGNPHDAMATKLYEAIREIERLRAIVATMKDVLMNRIVASHSPTLTLDEKLKQ